MKHYEDIVVGRKISFGRYHVTREEVMDFARKYDAQPFHLDDDAAAETYFGRISASGWHTSAMTMAMIVEDAKADPRASLGSPGLEKLHWPLPVYPGDTLRVESEVIAKRRSRTKPEIGLLTSHVRTFNQKDDVVLDMVSILLIRVRDPGAPID